MPNNRRFVDFRAVKAAINIEQILDHYGLFSKLSRRGDTLSGACPIHNGSNPTQFRVSLSKNCWNCFGDCKRGGNALDFVALKEAISAREAAIRMSEWFHLSIETPRPSKSPDNATARQASAGSQPRAARQMDSETEGTGPNKPLGFQLRNLDVGHPYLNERGLSAEVISEFGLGYCAKGSMNGRVVIPIHNRDGQIVAYAGRWPGEPPDGTPKYMLPIGFKKSQELFNIHRAIKASADESLVIVEGFFDCIALWQLGVRRIVALMGSSLSPEQEKLIHTITNNDSHIVVMLDADEAGRVGAGQALQRLAKAAFVKVVCLEKEGQQPSDLSAEQLSEVLEFGQNL